MQKVIRKIHFKKGLDSVVLNINSEGKTIETKYNTEFEILDNEYFVEIPAFNISLSTKDEKSIKQSVHESVLSFFNYRLNKQGIEQFILTMFDLGFEIKNVSDGLKNRVSDRIIKKRINQVTEKFIMA